MAAAATRAGWLKGFMPSALGLTAAPMVAAEVSTPFFLRRLRLRLPRRVVKAATRAVVRSPLRVGQVPSV